MFRKIKSHATYTLEGNTLICRGTEVKQIGDIFSDLLLCMPFKIKHIGFVSLGVYLQARYIYKTTSDHLLGQDSLELRGHSLGSGNILLNAVLLLKAGYKGKITINAIGGVKCISPTVSKYLKKHNVKIIWRVRYRDPVPHIGFWSEPIHSTPREGEKRRHILDYDIKEHIMY